MNPSRTFGLAPQSLCVCTQCLSPKHVEVVSAPRQLKRYPWVITLKCSLSEEHGMWHVCRFCKALRSQMKTDQQLRRHHKRCHQESPPTSNVNGSQEYEDVCFPCEHSNVLSPMPEVNFNFMNQSCKRFFGKQHQCGGGIADLLSQVYFNSEASITEINPPDGDLGLQILLLTTRLTPDERDIFSNIISLFGKVIESRVAAELQKQRKQDELLSRKYFLSFPKISTSLREMVFRRKNSFSEIIPMPSVLKIGDYSYVSLLSVISNFLAHDFAYDEINGSPNISDAVTSVSNSPIAKKLLHRSKQRLKENASSSDTSDLVTLYLFEWSDGFEPNSVKSNRGSVWAKTVTISPTGDARHNTYPLSFGPAKGDRLELDERYKNDLQSLREGPLHEMYNGRTKRMCYVHVELIASLQDQPERRDATCISRGNSLYTSRFGYLVNLKKLVDIVVPCANCRTTLLETETGVTDHDCARCIMQNCQECAAWNFDAPNKRKMLRTQPPKEYPTSELIYHGQLETKECTFGGMIKAVEVAHKKMIEKNWNSTTARAYLASEGINDSTQEKVVEHARFCLADMDCSDPELRATIDRDKEFDPTMYSMYKGSPNWKIGIEVWQHVEAVMHLVFHGIQKHLMKAVERWASLRGSQTNLHRFGNGTLESIQALRVEWCRAVPYNGDGFGGWYGENYLAMARLIPWFYSQLDKLGEDDESYEGDPTTDPKESFWTKKQNTAWLKARGLPVPKKSSARELRELVLGYLSSDSPPEIVTKPTVTAEAVMSMLCSAHRMHCLIMTRSVTEEYLLELDLQIKTFLTKFHEFDATLKSKKEKSMPGWISSYNFICLLNLPRIAKEYGPLCNLWEGGYQGEGFIRLAKPHIKSGLRKNWEINLHKNVLKEKFLSACLKKGNSKHGVKNCIMYSTRAEIDAGIMIGKTLSCVRLSEEKLAFLLTDRRQIQIKLQYSCTVNSLDYFQLRLGTLETKDNNIDDVISYCLLLPRLSEHGLPKPEDSNANIGYAIIDSNWNSIQK